MKWTHRTIATKFSRLHAKHYAILQPVDSTCTNYRDQSQVGTGNDLLYSKKKNQVALTTLSSSRK